MGTSDTEHGAAKTYDAPGHLPTPPRTELRPGWHVPEHLDLPAPTSWPAVMALAVTFLARGLLASSLIVAVGVILFAVALYGWIGDLRHGH